MKVTLNKQFKQLSGAEMGGMRMGQVLAEALSASNKGNSIKLYNWALKLYNKESLEMDDTDFEVLRGLIETSEMIQNLFKAQITIELDKIKEASNKQKKS